MHRLMSEMLKISQNTPLEKVDEGLLNAWNAVLQIAAKDGDQTAIRIIMKNYGKERYENKRFNRIRTNKR